MSDAKVSPCTTTVVHGAMEFLTAAPSEWFHKQLGRSSAPTTQPPSPSSRQTPNHSTPFSLLTTDPNHSTPFSLLTTDPQPLNPRLPSHDRAPTTEPPSPFSRQPALWPVDRSAMPRRAGTPTQLGLWNMHEPRLWINLRPNRSYDSTCVKDKAGGSLCSLYSCNNGRLGSREPISLVREGQKRTSTRRLKFIKTKIPLKSERFTSLKL